MHPLKELLDHLEMLGQLLMGLESAKEQHGWKEMNTGQLHIVIQAQPALHLHQFGICPAAQRAALPACVAVGGEGTERTWRRTGQ